jgi:flagellar hook assembly protein FlgD
VGNAPAAASLGQNFPNPFNPATTIEFSLKAGADVTLAVFDVRGARVRTLARGHYVAGPHRVDWNGTNDRGEPVSSGVYYYRLRGAGIDLTHKMVLLK